MENRVYPSFEQLAVLNNPLTAGEWKLIRYFDEFLPKDPNWVGDSDLSNLDSYDGWIIFVQPYLNGTRPDVVVFNPYVGAVIYEVKDWNLDNYELGVRIPF